MKTFSISTATACLMAGLATFVAAGSLSADEAGFVRLSDFDSSVDGTSGESEVVVRGASNYRNRNAQTSRALRRLFQKDVNCDSCLPAACCAPACEAPAACCPPTCEAPAACCCPIGDECCPNACDGCSADAQFSMGSGCALCGGRGCSACNGGQGGYGAYGQNGAYGSQCGSGRACVNRNCMADFMCGQAARHRYRNRLASARLGNYLCCKFGYFIPTGNGGVGSPLFGHYEVVYPANADYADARDGEVYAAQGYGGAVSVPLAPNVRQAYNYGWGIPSSRLTPVSNTTP